MKAVAGVGESYVECDCLGMDGTDAVEAYCEGPPHAHDAAEGLERGIVNGKQYRLGSPGLRLANAEEKIVRVVIDLVAECRPTCGNPQN